MTSKLAAPPWMVTSEQREILRRLSRSSSLPYRTVLQAKALSRSANGEATYEVSRQLPVAPNSVRQWRRRFEVEGVDAVGVTAPSRGRTSWLPDGTVADGVSLTMNELPEDVSTQWSTSPITHRVGVSNDTVA